jgi:hypothetical protein
MINASQLLMLLLNLYCSLALTSPLLAIKEVIQSNAISKEIILSIKSSPEAAIDKLMEEYMTTLERVQNIEDEAKAVQAMKLERHHLMKATKAIKPRLSEWINTLSKKEEAAFKEKMFVKPYLKTSMIR